jgi:aspartyl-tRNA(Asn)/glutamyl-tRNA(Gln) amidotransferase subunit C
LYNFVQGILPISAAFTMSLSSQDIARIANLARLELSSTESAKLLIQTNDFFNIVEKMRSVDTTGIEPLAHPIDTIQAMSLRLRNDIASELDNREANQRTAPAVKNGLFLVPKVIE